MYSGALANPAARGVNAGAPPNLPDQLPSPTGMGAIPTGDPGSTPKEIADAAVIKMRAAVAAFPNLKQQLEPCIEALKAAARGGSGPSALSKPSAPGAPLPEISPTEVSGTAGT